MDCRSSEGRPPGRCAERIAAGAAPFPDVDLDKALADCNAAVNFPRGRRRCRPGRRLVRYRMGDLDGAIADYDASLKVTNGAWPLSGRGLATLNTGLTAAGQADRRQAASRAPRIAQDAASHGLDALSAPACAIFYRRIKIPGRLTAWGHFDHCDGAWPPRPILSAALVDAACNLVGGLPVLVSRSGGYSEVAVKINGADAHMILDSGAYYSEISPAAEARLKLPPTARENDFRDRGVGGETGRVGILLAKNFTLASTTHQRGVRARRTADRGRRRPPWRELSSPPRQSSTTRRTTLFASSCRQGRATEPLAYWSTTQPYSVADIDPPGRNGAAELKGSAWVNGVKVKVIFDTGAPSSIMSLAAAERAGVRLYDEAYSLPAAPEVSPAIATSRSGPRPSPASSWATRKLRQPHLHRPASAGTTTPTCCSADFFRSHQVIVPRPEQAILHLQRRPGFRRQPGVGDDPRRQAVGRPGPEPSAAQEAFEKTTMQRSPI